MSSFDKIVNPATGKKVNINGNLGKKILENYKNITKINNKLDYNQTGGAHQLQRMIAALLVEGGLTFRKNFGAVKDSDGNSTHNRNFNTVDTTAHYFTQDGQRSVVNLAHSGPNSLWSSYSGRAKTHNYNERRAVIQKIKHSADMHILNDNDIDILTESSFFYHYDPTNTFSTSAQTLIDDFIIDFVLNIDGTKRETIKSVKFENIFFRRQLYGHTVGTRTPSLFFTSRYRQNNGNYRNAPDQVDNRFKTGNKKYSTPLLNLGVRDAENNTLTNFPATEKIYNKYMSALPQARRVEKDIWITNLINKRKEAYTTEDTATGKRKFKEAWEAENVVREIYLQSIFDALIDITDFNNRSSWVNVEKNELDEVVREWNNGELDNNSMVNVRTYYFINKSIDLPQRMFTQPAKVRHPTNGILMNFEEFKREFIDVNSGLRDPESVQDTHTKKSRKKDIINAWIKTIAASKKYLLFNKIYNFPSNTTVNSRRSERNANLRRGFKTGAPTDLYYHEIIPINNSSLNPHLIRSYSGETTGTARRGPPVGYSNINATRPVARPPPQRRNPARNRQRQI